MIVRNKFPIGRAALLRGLDFGRRGSAALPMVGVILFFALGATAETTNTLSAAEIQGRQFAQQLLEQGPVTNFVQTGVLNIRADMGKRSEIPLRIQTLVNGTGWQAVYETTSPSKRVRLIVLHETGQPNGYYLWEGLEGLDAETDRKANTLVGSKIMTPFAGSDFWVADLGQDFFHWPQQKLLKKVVRSSRGCSVLESVNPDPATNGYSRVVSWIDSESLGPLHVEAYDAKGRLLKEYDAKKLKKVNGQWQVEEIEICNDQTGSRTRLEFDLKKQ
jgi:Outer membrane lipoprotein-sorting protein